MAWYDDITAGMLALGGGAGVLITGLGKALLNARRELARHTSEIKVERSEASTGRWLNEQAIARATQAEADSRATMRAAKELLDQRMVDVEKMARLEEKLANCERNAKACEDRAQRAETRASVAEDHMRKQAEQILVQSMNIDRLTTELSKHDAEAASRLAPKRKQQPLLLPDEGSEMP